MESQFIGRVQEAPTIWSFYFSKPSGFVFDAGDYTELELFYKSRGGRRWFTVASAPHEHTLQFTIKIPALHSEYKDNLLRLVGGDRIRLSPAIGTFNLPRTPNQLLFVAGGVGITPYRSMHLHNNTHELGHSIHTLYISRTEERVFADIMQLHDHTFHNPKSRTPVADIIRNKVPDYHKRIIYLAGPEAMMTEAFDDLQAAGIARKNLRLSYFTNYSTDDL